MIADSLQVKRRAIAYLYQMVPALDRNDNMSFYDELNKHMVDLPEVLQQPQELVLLRRAASNPEQLDEVRVGAMAAPIPVGPGMTAPAAFRCLVSEQGSNRPLKLFVDLANTVHEAFGKVWGPRTGRVQLVEVSYIAAVAVGHSEGAVGFLREHVTRTAEQVAEHLGRNYDGLAVKFTSSPVVQVGKGGPHVPLVGAHVDIAFEPFLQDARLLLVNLVVKWPALQFRLNDLNIPPQARAAAGGAEFIELNVEAKAPSHYLDHAYQYLEKHVLPFIVAVGQ